MSWGIRDRPAGVEVRKGEPASGQGQSPSADPWPTAPLQVSGQLDLRGGHFHTGMVYFTESRDAVAEREAEAQAEVGARALVTVTKDILWFPLSQPTLLPASPMLLLLFHPAICIYLA